LPRCQASRASVSVVGQLPAGLTCAARSTVLYSRLRHARLGCPRRLRKAHAAA
jgi:hypothetical protein